MFRATLQERNKRKCSVARLNILPTHRSPPHGTTTFSTGYANAWLMHALKKLPATEADVAEAAECLKNPLFAQRRRDRRAGFKEKALFISLASVNNFYFLCVLRVSAREFLSKNPVIHVVVNKTYLTL